MNDFHADLERELHRAAGRRRRTAGALLPALVAAAAVVVVLVVVAGAEDPEREVAAPPATTGAGAGCGEEAPQAVIDRFAVLRTEPDPPTDFRLDDPMVAKAYGPAARSVRFANGLEALAVPVAIGDCANPVPGLCLVPFDRRWPTRCGQVNDTPFVLSLQRANEHGETEIVALAGDDVPRVWVTSPTNRIDVDSEAGRITATVPEPDPERVTVSAP